MTARHETTLAIARRLAESNGRTLHRLSARQRLATEVMALDIVRMVEQRMSQQSHELAVLIKRYWELPA